MGGFFVCFSGVFRLLEQLRVLSPQLSGKASPRVWSWHFLYKCIGTGWGLAGRQESQPLSSDLCSVKDSRQVLWPLGLSLPPQLPNGDKLSYLPPGGRGSSENEVILSVQVLKVVLPGEQSDWDWLVCYKPYTPLFHSSRAVTWSVTFQRLIQRKLLTWLQVLKSLVHLRTKYQPCLVNTQPCSHLGSCSFSSLSPILSECCFLWFLSHHGDLWGWVLRNPLRWVPQEKASSTSVTWTTRS